MEELLREAVARRASDLHLTALMPPMLRVDGRLVPLAGYEALSPANTQELVFSMLRPEQQTKLEQQGQLDFSYGVQGLGRFRVNGFRQRGTYCAALRIIPTQVPSYRELGLPEIVHTLAQKPQGLVLVTGPTGSGKSTTLASMLDAINEERDCHIITLEDPIEYLHRHKRSIINQREIGLDTGSFSEGLRAALRQDPDVILVGEMRDLETIATAITAAETGHLVLATLHTNDAVQTVDRIIDVFPPHQQPQIRTQLAAVLQGVLAQQLLPRRDGQGRVVAVEVLVATAAVRNLIREGKTHQMLSLLQTGGKVGMQTFEAAYRDLVRRGLVSEQTVLARQREQLEVTGTGGF
ncbi:MAG TPA: type IV pilus twitching motility protein PilT [Firmicutes bacterium]|nr:type IV pilus twitching motility protein PilT [Bacillota bacterium]